MDFYLFICTTIVNDINISADLNDSIVHLNDFYFLEHKSLAITQRNFRGIPFSLTP